MQLQNILDDCWIVKKLQNINKAPLLNNIKYIFIYQNQYQPIHNFVSSLKQLHQVIVCTTIQYTLELIKIYPNQGFFIIATSKYIKQLPKLIEDIKQIYKVYIIQEDQQNTISSSNIINHHKLVRVSLNEHLLEKLRIQQQFYKKLNNFPQFIKLRCFSITRFNIYALMTTTINKNAHQHFINFLQNLFSYDPDHNIKQLIQTYKFESDISNLLKFDSNLNILKILNQFLCVSNDPYQLAYIRLPIFELFNHIKTNYKSKTNQKMQLYKSINMTIQERSKFKCQQIIQIFGFLSSDKIRVPIQQKNMNTSLIIKINQKSSRFDQLDYGYIQFNNQVIFNILSTFKVEKIEQITQNKIQITLIYGSFPQICKRFKQKIKLSKQEEQQIELYRKQRKEIKKKIKNQQDLVNFLTKFDTQRSSQVFFNESQSQKTYSIQSNDDKIIQKYLKLLNNTKQTFGQNHQTTANIYNDIGRIYDKKGNYITAVNYYFKSLQIKLKVLGQHHPQIAQSYNNIGSIYFEQSDYQKALQYYFKSLSIYETRIDQKKLVSTCLNNIGLVYFQLRDYENSIAYYLRSVQIMQQIGDGDYIILSIYKSLGSAYKQKQQYLTSIKFYVKYLQTYKTYKKDDDDELRVIYNELAEIYQIMGQKKKALEYYVYFLQLQMKTLNQNNLEIAIYSNKIGLFYYSIKEYDNALNYLTKAYNIMVKILGENSIDVAEILYNIGMIYKDINKKVQANDFFLKSLRIKQQNLGNLNKQTSQILEELDQLSLQHFETNNLQIIQSNKLSIKQNSYLSQTCKNNNCRCSIM